MLFFGEQKTCATINHFNSCLLSWSTTKKSQRKAHWKPPPPPTSHSIWVGGSTICVCLRMGYPNSQLFILIFRQWTSHFGVSTILGQTQLYHIVWVKTWYPWSSYPDSQYSWRFIPKEYGTIWYFIDTDHIDPYPSNPLYSPLHPLKPPEFDGQIMKLNPGVIFYPLVI